MLVVDGTIGLYLGWVRVAPAANVAAVLVASGGDLPSASTAIGAIVTALLILVTTAVFRLRAVRSAGIPSRTA